jgi:DNA-binding helix-hairpin-helix protein with protein kinase domain
MPLIDDVGRPVTLGDRVGPRGGEGEIFRVNGEPGMVAKRYHQPADSRKAEKLRRLRDLSQPALQNVAAWPNRLLFDAAAPQRVAGFVMPFREGRRIERLYSPRDRLKDYPKADWHFLLHVAWNCAAAFETLHEHGILMADVNEGNILVGDDGIVRLIDCDSYQVTAADGRALTCDVGVALWTPPELQRRSLTGVVRTADHDRFGLAVLIFHLLFMGRHPYAGVPISPAADDTQLEEAIARDHFAYGANHLAFGVRPPSNLLTPAALPASFGALFERAFGQAGSGTSPSGRGRPTGREWAGALGAVTLRRCTSNPLHVYPESAGECSWCQIYREGGPRYFAVLVATGGATRGQVEQLWREIVAKVPGNLPVRAVSAYPIPNIRPKPCPSGLKPLREGFGQWMLTTLFGVSPLNPEYKRERERREAAVRRARAELDQALAAAQAVRTEYQRHFTAKRAELEKLYRRHLNLDNERAEELDKLEARKREILLKNFLDSRLLAHANIAGIGSARKATLKAYGIETALDVNGNLRVPGIGPGLRQALVSWRAQVTNQFVFNPAAALPRGEIANLDQQMRDRRLELEAKLRTGPVDLDRLTGQAQQALLRLENRIPELVCAHAQAIVDAQQTPAPNP